MPHVKRRVLKLKCIDISDDKEGFRLGRRSSLVRRSDCGLTLFKSYHFTWCNQLRQVQGDRAWHATNVQHTIASLQLRQEVPG